MEHDSSVADALKAYKALSEMLPSTESEFLSPTFDHDRVRAFCEANHAILSGSS